MLDKQEVDIWVVIEGEPFLSRAKAYRKEKERVLEIYRVFAKERGAEELTMYTHLTGLRFPPGKIPAGWGKPMASGFSFTKKTKDGQEEREKLLALPKLPKVSEVYGNTILEELRFNNEYGEGFSSIGKYFDCMAVGWIGDTYIGRVVDTSVAAKNHLEQNPKHKISKKYLNWKLPVGLRQISKAQLDLMTAKYEVEQEEKENNGKNV